MNMVQYELQFATVSVPAEVSHEEIRSTVANVVTDAGTKAKNTTTTTASTTPSSTAPSMWMTTRACR